jgi:hypothetical protein
LKIERDTPAVAIQVNLQTQGMRVSGRVVTTDSAPLFPQRVTIRGATGQDLTAQARVNGNGAFEFSGIPPGAYTLLTSALDSGSTTSNIVVSDRDLTGVPIAGLSDVQAASTAQYANEAAAILNMQAIQRAEKHYNNAFRKYGNVSDLVAAGLLDARYSATISGYTIDVTASDKDATLIAGPASAASGRYVFFGGESLAFWYRKASGPTPGMGAIARDARGLLTSADGGPLERVQTCGSDVPVCLRYGQAGAPVPEIPGRVTVSADGANPPGVFPSNVFVGFISSSGGGNLVGVRADGSFRVPMPPGEWRIAIQNLPAGYSVKSALAGSTDLLREPLNTSDGAGSIEVTLEYRPQPAR